MAVFSWKPSPHHLDLVVLPADIVLCMICWNLLLLQAVLQHSACLYFQRIVFEDWNHFDLAVSHFVFVLSDLFLTVCRTARLYSGLHSWVESGLSATMSVLLGFLIFFDSGDVTERFYVFFYPQKCGQFFLIGKTRFSVLIQWGDFDAFFNLLHFAK